MEKFKQIKRNHHYVWSYYLKRWATGKNIFYISQSGKIACDSIKGLAKETDFYKISPLTNEDVEFIKAFSANSPVELQKIHMSHLNNFIGLSNISHAIANENTENENFKIIDKAIKHNSLENLHTIYEDAAVKIVDELSIGNRSILNSKMNMISFCAYLGQQITRTKAFKEKSIGSAQSAPEIKEKYPREMKLLEKNWWFISFMLGLNIGVNLFESKARDNHIFIVNNTSKPFITSDTPIINVHSSLSGMPKNVPPTKADFFIPLSPKYAYMINNSTEYNQLANSIDESMVNKFNAEIYKKSYKIVFGSSETALTCIKKGNKHKVPA